MSVSQRPGTATSATASSAAVVPIRERGPGGRGEQGEQQARARRHEQDRRDGQQCDQHEPGEEGTGERAEGAGRGELADHCAGAVHAAQPGAGDRRSDHREGGDRDEGRCGHQQHRRDRSGPERGAEHAHERLHGEHAQPADGERACRDPLRRDQVGPAPAQRRPGRDPGQRHADDGGGGLEGQPDVGGDESRGEGLDDQDRGTGAQHDDPGEQGDMMLVSAAGALGAPSSVMTRTISARYPGRLRRVRRRGGRGRADQQRAGRGSDPVGARALRRGVSCRSTKPAGPAAEARPPAGTTEVWTDGACSGNPGPGGWAWAVPDGPFRPAAAARNDQPAHGAAGRPRGGAGRSTGRSRSCSDSTYVVNCFRDGWWRGWLARGWVNTAKKPVANRDLWEPLITGTGAGDVSFRWVKGHSGDPMNDVVDRLAVEQSRAAATG